MDYTIPRPEFPKRAIITAGMPYGNKSLHFGHIGGVFVPADIFRRFLSDRIGSKNVIFVSGTDCYGSPIIEYYRKKQEEGLFTGSLEEFVKENHQKQKSELEAFNISTKSYYTSAFDGPGEKHRDLCNNMLKTLFENGVLKKISKPQFYDEKNKIFLNGRQVEGKCPIPGCKSTKAYADECEMGHPFDPEDLIDPVSSLSGERPTMKETINWYIDLYECKELLKNWTDHIGKQGETRKILLGVVNEFLNPPLIYMKKEYEEEYNGIAAELPEHELSRDKKSLILEFKTLELREEAVALMGKKQLIYRPGKTLTPFRLTGNVDWGVKTAEIDGLDDLTFWVWPESLIAPISFTSNYLAENKVEENQTWQDWWFNEDSSVYQFIGEDNIFFYSLAEMAIFLGLEKDSEEQQKMIPRLPKLIPNCHLLQGNAKVSSSGQVKPASATDLLDYYTADQLRAHFFSLGLGMRPINFRPKPLDADAKEKDSDPVLKEGNLLSNVLNRICRSCFYTTQKYFEGKLPHGEISSDVLEDAKKITLQWEMRMHRHEFHKAMAALDKYIRGASKYWAKHMTNEVTEEQVHQVLIDMFHMVRTIIFLLHPVAPVGTEKVRDYLRVNEQFFDWQNFDKDIYHFVSDPENHILKELEPRVDFFDKHPYQIG